LSRLGERFVLERQVGAGGMARVFKGKDVSLRRSVAIKILKPGYGETDIGLRFEREGRTAAKLAHPNIVQVYDAGQTEFEGHEVSYIVMEYVPGGDLKALIDEKGSLSNEELVRLGADVSAGLAHAHERGVIHRDIKPHNILLDERGQPKLTDFGIARALDATQATQSGSYLGTALYSSPEQLRGERVTPKSDVYSLGIALYQAATGQAPFAGTPIEVASQHVSRPPTTPSVLGANLDREVEALIIECIEKDPDRRPTAQQVHERLREAIRPAPGDRAYAAPPMPEPAQDEKDSAPPPEDPTAGPLPGPARGERGRRRPAIIAAAALLLVLLGAGVAYAMLADDDSDQAEAPAEDTAQQQAAAPGSTGEETTQSSGGGEGQASTSGQTERDQSGQTNPAGSTQEEEDGLSAEAAEQTIQEVYSSAEDADYATSYGLLSQRFKQTTASTQGQWSGQFETLQSLDFEEGPTAQVSDDTATVSGVTIASHTDRTERNDITWTLVAEGEEWKLDKLTVNDQQLL
jgi:serine/threonine-protein kinase